MHNMRKLLWVLTAIALATLALPSVADNGKKKYSLDMTLVSVPPAQTTPPFSVQATITNEGNSTINSFILSETGLTIVGVDQPATGQATFTGSSVSVTHMHPLKSGQSLNVTVYVKSCGDGAWGAVVWTGSSLNGQTFNLVAADSNLATHISCGNLASGAAFTVPDSVTPGCVTGHRGYYDKDGSISGTSLPYFVTNTVPTDGDLHFRWPVDNTGDNTGDPAATFEYSVCATGPEPPDPPAPGATQVAWLNTDGSLSSTPGTPAFITAQDCLDPDVLPAPYGTLLSSVLPSDTFINVDTTTPLPQVGGVPPGSIAHATPPFDVVIRNVVSGTERMTVTGITCADGGSDDAAPDTGECSENEGGAPSIWFVTRGVGGTTAASHANVSLVMSTPLPILPTQPDGSVYTTGNQAQMCIATDQQTCDEESGVCTHSTTFIDIGDGWGNHP